MLLTANNIRYFKLYKSTETLTNVFHNIIVLYIVYTSNYFYESTFKHHRQPGVFTPPTPVLEILS